jgi:16S rRNA G966 N2-methylase RsmD
MFPEVESKKILHLFSGSLGPKEKGDRVDVNPNLNPDICCKAEELSENVTYGKYELIIADPPYSNEDAKHYGTPMINRNEVVKQCSIILPEFGHLVWLDQVFPMFKKKIMRLIGTIGIVRSTNHRVRTTFIWTKVENNEKCFNEEILGKELNEQGISSWLS